MASSEPKTLQITLQQNKTSIQQGAAPSSIKFAQFLIFFSLSICIMRCLEDVELKSALFSCTQYKHKDDELYKQCLQLHSGDPKRKKEKTPITARGRRDGNPWQEFKELWECHMNWTPERKKNHFLLQNAISLQQYNKLIFTEDQWKSKSIYSFKHESKIPSIGKILV